MNMPAAERVARSVALEQAYVYDVYEQFSDNPRSRPWPRVNQFLDSLEPGSLVCDVGCGNGKYLNTNSTTFNIGGEKCMRLSKIAREKNNEVLVLDNLALPFRDESLDAVLSIAVVHHFATTERRVCALRELARVLRIGGRLIITVWAMEQRYRKFESQDVLVPWRRPQMLSTPSLELTSTTNTSEDDGFSPYHAYTQTSDSDSIKSNKGKTGYKKRGKTKHKGRSIDPGRNSSPSSSSLSSPNETCYSFVRRAIQKLAGGKRVGHRPWFLESWTTCGKEPTQKRYDKNGCDCCDYENIQDIPIELRRVDDDELPQRRQTFPSSQILNDIYFNLKSKSMTNIKTNESNIMTRSQSSIPSIPEITTNDVDEDKANNKQKTSLNKPRLVKQKQSICEEDADEALDKATDMKVVVPNSTTDRLFGNRYGRGSVYKQRSLNEELMSTDRLKEKERVRQNIQKQASLNEDLIYHRHSASIKESIFSATTAKRLQLFKTDFTNKLKNSTTNIEKVTSASLKNGFVRIFQNWKSPETTPLSNGNCRQEDEVVAVKKNTTVEEVKENSIERRPSKEDGSDSSKDSSLQSDTSVDSEDSFASVIFVPKSNPMSPNLSPGPTSPRVGNNCSAPNSPRIKQSSCPTSPRIKQMPLSVYPLTKQLSSPKPTTNTSLEPTFSNDTKIVNNTINVEVKKEIPTEKKTVPKTNLAQKYHVQEIPKFKKTIPKDIKEITAVSKMEAEEDKDKIASLNKIKELLSQKTGFGMRARSNYPIVRHSSINNGKLESIVKPLPKLLSLELFNPETDDKDSDSSVVSSPDSVNSVISNTANTQINNNSSVQTRFLFPSTKNNKPDNKNDEINVIGKSLAKEFFEAAADVANSLDNAVNKVIKSSPSAKRRELKTGDVLSVIQRQYSDSTPLLNHDECSMDIIESSWDNECQKHLTDFADKLSERLLHEIDQYQEQNRKQSSNTVDIDDPYINRLSEELNDLSRLSAEIQKQNEYLAKLSVSDHFSQIHCAICKSIKCICEKRTESNSNNNNNNIRPSKVPFSDINIKVTDKSDEDVITNIKRSQSRHSFKKELSIESCESEKSDRGSSSNSILSSVPNSLQLGNSMESNEGCCSDKGSSDSHKDTISHSRCSVSERESTTDSQKDTNSISRFSDGGSTASLQSLASCPDWKTFKNKLSTDRSISEDKYQNIDSNMDRIKDGQNLNQSFSDTSQESLPSDNMGGEIIYHRFYHVFREGELDQLIEKYVENLHIISSYYDHSSWCVVAEKVQVWTI